MNTEILIAKLDAYGADVTATMERFMDDVELYADCLAIFIADKNFTQLGEALEAEAYTHAFEAAHALKGVAGNLGLVPLYGAICSMVESLRTQKYADDLPAKYEEILRQLETLKAVLEEE